MFGDITFILFIIAMCFSLLWAASSEAEDDLRAVPIIKGTPAPFGGMLMTIDLATNLGVKVETCETKKKLELEHAKRMCSLGKSQLNELFGIRERALQAKLRVTAEALERAERERQVAFYEEPAFNLLAGVIGGVTLTVTGIYALSLLQTN